MRLAERRKPDRRHLVGDLLGCDEQETVELSGERVLSAVFVRRRRSARPAAPRWDTEPPGLRAIPGEPPAHGVTRSTRVRRASPSEAVWGVALIRSQAGSERLGRKGDPCGDRAGWHGTERPVPAPCRPGGPESALSPWITYVRLPRAQTSPAMASQSTAPKSGTAPRLKYIRMVQTPTRFSIRFAHFASGW